MKLNFGFGLHTTWRDRQNRTWLEFNSFNNDNILSAVCVDNTSNLKKDIGKIEKRILKSLGVYKYE